MLMEFGWFINRELMDHLVIREQKEHKEVLGKVVLKEPEELKVNLERQVPLEQPEDLENQEDKDQLAYREHLDQQDHLESLDQLVNLEPEGPLDQEYFTLMIISLDTQ
jgi:hypothetical protein